MSIPAALYEGVWYLAGPMSGLPRFNFDYFCNAQSMLSRAGVNTLNPVFLDPPEMRDKAWDSLNGEFSDLEGTGTWGDSLSRDIKVIADEVAGLIMLPGWSMSKGARLEAYAACTLDKPVYYFDSWRDPGDDGMRFQIKSLPYNETVKMLCSALEKPVQPA